MFKGSVSERGDDSRQIVFTNLSYASKEILMEGKSQQYLLCNNIHFGFSHLTHAVKSYISGHCRAFCEATAISPFLSCLLH